jgi:hypothetical protein
MGEIKQDYKTAIEYYEKAVKEEVHDAYCNLGNIYALGLGEEQGIPRDIFKGIGYLVEGPKRGVARLHIPWAVCTRKASTFPKTIKKPATTWCSLLYKSTIKRIGS